MGGRAPDANSAYVNQAISYMNTLPAFSQVQTQAARQALPQYSQAGLTNLERYALPYAAVGNAVTGLNALSGAATNAAVLRGPGADIARAGTAINREANPEFYATREAASPRVSDLLSSINLRGLAPGEAAAMERGMNQFNQGSGNAGLTNPTNTLSNAMMFGQGMQAKRDALASALGTATNFLNSSQSTSFNPVAVALSQPSVSTQSNFGTGQFTGVPSVMGQAGQTSSGILGATTANNTTNQPLQAQSSYNNSAAGIMGSMPSYS